ncbi:Hint domain-containing protein [Rhizobium binxianense]
MSNEGGRPRVNKARRHFLGVAAAAGARFAAMGAAAGAIFPSMAKAQSNAWWKNGEPSPGRGPGPGNGPGGSAMCLLRGTAIRTPKGEVCIEKLRIGDLVETASGRAAPVKWIGRQTFRRSGPTWNREVLPIRIAPFALDERTPRRALYLTAGHGLFLDGVLIKAADLVNETSIAPVLPAPVDSIEYFQIMLDRHDVVLAEGAPVETFLLEAENYEAFANFAEFARLYPADRHAAMTPFAPIVGYGGREHLKALLRLAAGRLLHIPSPLQDAYERIAARGEHFADQGHD